MKKIKQIYENIKKTPKIIWVYSFIAILLAIIFTIGLDYLSFYFHELGHANSAIVYSMAFHQNTTTINFTYVPFWGISSIMVPQQTSAIMPNIMSVYGVLSTFLLYGIILLALSKIKIITKDKWLEYPLLFPFFLLIIKDILLNLVCGTDGLDIPCPNALILAIGFIIRFLILFSLGLFFIRLIIIRRLNKNINTQKPNI